MPDAKEFEAAVEAGCEGLEAVSGGLCPTCPECQRDFDMEPREFFAAYEAGKVADEGGFSWHACECCGSHLGGNRYAAHGLDADGELVHFSICADCLCYLANGDMPENWEA
jgi:hypothetical protein